MNSLAMIHLPVDQLRAIAEARPPVSCGGRPLERSLALLVFVAAVMLGCVGAALVAFG
jgi:hypothetical protein